MPYMLAPGARLEVGPDGKMYEAMGCGRGCTGLGALDKQGRPIGAPTSALKAGRMVALDPRLAAALPRQSGVGKFFSGSLGPTILIGGVAATAAAIFLLTRKRRRR